MKQSEVHPTNIFREKVDIVGQTVSVNHSKDQQWFYIDRQNTNEMTLIKIWDNKEDVANSEYSEFHLQKFVVDA